jgi:hypothetical protein
MKAKWPLPFLIASLAHCSAPAPNEGSSARGASPSARAGAPASVPAAAAESGGSSTPETHGAGSNPENSSGLIVTPSGIAGGGSVASPDPDKCGEHHFDLERKPAELLLVLDRSASMQDAPSGAAASTTKWQLVVPAVNQAITETDASISWGMKVFPEGSGSECDAAAVTDHVDVEIGAMNASKVTSAVSTATPEGDGTPTAAAIDHALAYLQSSKNKNPKYILLATDGEPSCPKPSDDARTLAVQSVAKAAAIGVHTFVVGVATTKSSATTALSEMAIAGMEPRDEDPNPFATRYYLANTKDELVTALQQITGQISGCTFRWDQPPPEPRNIAVKVGGVKAPRDANNGWEYLGSDYKGVEVHGTWCDKIKTTAANVVEIIFGCPDVEIL